MQTVTTIYLVVSPGLSPKLAYFSRAKAEQSATLLSSPTVQLSVEPIELIGD